MRIIVLGLIASAMLFADVEDRETIKQTLPSAPRLDVSVIQGYVHITGYNGSQVEMVANKIFRADDAGELSLAKQEIRLDSGVIGDTLKICIQGPWRRDCKAPQEERESWNRNQQRHYSFTYNIELRVPMNMEVTARTINRGDITIKNVNGRFEARNVNGPITLEGMGSSGSAHTVNGPVTALFSRTPQAPVQLKTVNGEIKAEFPKDTNASLRFKTMHGEIYTDFPTNAMQTEAGSGEKRGTKYVYQTKRSFAVRVGNGGPEHSFENINGDIQIKQRGQ